MDANGDPLGFIGLRRVEVRAQDPSMCFGYYEVRCVALDEAFAKGGLAIVPLSLKDSHTKVTIELL